VNISIIVPTVNNSAFTIKCFDSIFACTKIPIRLIWVDNGSDFVEWKTVRDWLVTHSGTQNVQMVRFSQNRGFTQAVNHGITIGEKDDVVVLNNDVEVTPGWLESMVETVTKLADVGIVGVVSDDFGFQSISNLGLKKSLNISQMSQDVQQRFKGQTKPVNMVAFFCTLITRKVIDRIGLMNDDYTHGLAGDDEYCHLARAAGFKVMWRLDAFVSHKGGKTFALLGIDRETVAKTEREKYKSKFLKVRDT